MEFFRKLFQSDFMPHGHCYYWTPSIVWTNAISDGIIAIAYCTIPLTLIYIVRARKDMNFVALVVLFAVFILGCGATHIMDVINIWKPVYRLDSLLRAITALASIGTAFMLVRITPSILLIPNPDVYKKLNEELREQINMLREKDKTIELLQRNKEISSELKSSELMFTVMADHIANLAWIANADGYITWYNMRWYEYTGKTDKEMEGWGWQYVLDPKELPWVLENWKNSLNTGEPLEMTFSLLGKDGVYRPFLTRAMPVKNEEGVVLKWVGTNTDITERIKAELELEQKNAELRRINEDLDNFVYTASHDLKAPITNLEGLLSGILDVKANQINEDEKIYFDMMEISVRKLNATIRDLTEISKVQKAIDPEKEKLEIRKVIEVVKEGINDIIKKTNTRISVVTGPDQITFSEKNLKSILTNLITNAINYKHPERDPEISISTGMEEDFLVLKVQDNGLGIEKSKMKDLFKMFKRLHDHVEGTGIGLYIVKRIMDNEGGRIEAESEPGVGTLFKVYFKC